jgi:hypothetical protein
MVRAGPRPEQSFLRCDSGSLRVFEVPEAGSRAGAELILAQGEVR